MNYEENVANESDSSAGVFQSNGCSLEKIAQLLARSLPRQPAPNYRAILEQFHEFDWSSINAHVEWKDKDGVASVIWQGDRYKRRSPSNGYGAVIYFSRAV